MSTGPLHSVPTGRDIQNGLFLPLLFPFYSLRELSEQQKRVSVNRPYSVLFGRPDGTERGFRHPELGLKTEVKGRKQMVPTALLQAAQMREDATEGQ